MKSHRPNLPHCLLHAVMATVVASMLMACATSSAFETPAQADFTAGSQALKKLPRRTGERVAVTIYEFRSELPALNARTAVDMFKTALVQSGQFRVLERTRLNEGVAREKQLQAGGFASGRAAQTQLRGAQYIFEGAVTETNSAERQRAGGVRVAGMQVGGGASNDSIAVDVRIVDAANGDIVDAVMVRKRVSADEASVNGVGNLLSTAMGRRGKRSPYTPDINMQQRRAEGIDSAVRAAIDEAVVQLAKRFE